MKFATACNVCSSSSFKVVHTPKLAGVGSPALFHVSFCCTTLDNTDCITVNIPGARFCAADGTVLTGFPKVTAADPALPPRRDTGSLG